jgi:diguanylate cyclase (GGDEF)-like protein
MPVRDPPFADEHAGRVQHDLRHQIADRLLERSDSIIADAAAIFPYSGVESLDAEYCRRIGQQLAQLLTCAVRDGRIDPRGKLSAELQHTVHDRRLSAERLFTFAYLTERATVDELALDDRIGAMSELWPLVAQLVRRASFDLLAAYVERTEVEPTGTAIIDKLTTLYSRSMFDAVLDKEVERAARFGYPVSLILFDVDHLSAINQQHGYGVGDKILERLGFLIRNYFRRHDWVARHGDDSIAVLLCRTDADRATDLAERVRSTVQERFGFVDHLTDEPVAVTVSAAVMNLTIDRGDVVDTHRLMTESEAAVHRAKRQGRNRVERVDGYSGADDSKSAVSGPGASSSPGITPREE